MQGIKRKRRCQNQCSQHLFSLKNLKKSSKYDIELTFCPKYQRQPWPPQHTFAEYNNDGLFYTSAFVLGVEKKLIAKNLQKEMLDHQKLIKENCQKYNQIVFPRPNSKHITCYVCREPYKNYYIHIFSDEHGEKIQASSYNVYLQQLCSLFQPLWEGCAQKADEMALRESDKGKSESEKRASEELNLDDILEEEDINSNPSCISQQIEDEEQEGQQAKEIVMRRPVRPYEPSKIQKPQKVFQNRESRKKSINFAAFFEDEPRKKIINDHRQAVSISSKKTPKTFSTTESKSKQKLVPKKQAILEEDDPFIIEYNARLKRKQKKSYYYLKKKERQEREQRERQLALKQYEKQGLNEPNKQQFEDRQQVQNLKLKFQHSISKSEEQEYEKYLDQFHQDEKKGNLNTNQVKNTFSSDLKLFEEVQKKPFINPLFQTFSKPNQQKNIVPKSFVNSINPRSVMLETSLISSEAHPLRKLVENGSRPQLSIDKKDDMDNEQKQQIIDKNKINFSPQNQLPLFHKLKNLTEKDHLKETEIRAPKPTQEVFNQYEQKIREYQKQKDYNGKYNSAKINPFQEKRNPQISSNNDESTVKISKAYFSKEFEQTHNFGGERKMGQQLGELKTEAFNAKYNTFSQAYYKKAFKEKELANSLPLNHLMPGAPYSNMHQFYPPYGYPISQYTYPLHEAQKADRSPMKYGQQREQQSYDRGYYYGPWQSPYYIPPPQTSIVPSQGNEVEAANKNFISSAYNPSKSDGKQPVYPSYPSYLSYPPANYPAYYHPSGASYAQGQRNQYPHPNSNMRIPPQPNTSININFPMYLPPYHGPYQYQPNPQRFPGQQPSTLNPSQFTPQNPPQTKTPGSQYSANRKDGVNNLPPYAEYQEYKKRQNERRR